jgi:FixJ family two-component response regulator
MSHELMDSIDNPIAFVVDDDDVDREVVAKLLKSHGVRVQTYSTADSFLRTLAPQQIGCIVLDILMPGMSGQELQDQLIQRQIKLPIIFVSGLVNVSIATQAMRLGATEVLEKPVLPEKLFSAVKKSFELAIAAHQAEHIRRDVDVAIGKLTPKERIVMQCLLDGRTMKEMSEICECSIATVARYQAKVLEKMESLNTALLAIKLHQAGITSIPN